MSKQIIYKAVAFILTMTYFILGQTHISVDPNTRYQTVEGWGGSLSWWANIAGGYTDAQIDSLCTWITSPDGLNMNVFVFNIAGGENPQCPFGSNHLRTDASIQGYKPTEKSPYDWTRDANQRKILLKLKQKRSDCIFSACSYSPPFWMTISGCTAGNKNGANNLKTTHYSAFADYLTDVVKYYHDSFGVTFRNLSPMNEPTNAWTAGGPQEGCSIWEANLQSTLINEVYNKLSSKNMLGYCNVSAMEGSYTDQTVTGINAYISDETISKITQINTHTYGGSQSTQLKLLADKHKKRLWQSESGPANVSQTGYDINLIMAQRVITDMRTLQPIAWLDWQLLDQGDVWGLIKYDDKPTFSKTKNYYARMHCSRFIKPGYTIICNDNANTLTALNPEKTELVAVIINITATDEQYKLDLNLFGTAGPAATVYKTTDGSENCSRVADAVISSNKLVFTATGRSVTTFVLPVSLAPNNPIANGKYGIKVKHSGKYMSVSQFSQVKGAVIEQWSWIDQPNLHFNLTHTSIGYKLSPAYNSNVVDVGSMSTTNGAAVFQWPDTEGANQRFSIIDVGGGYYKIVARHSAKCLSVLGSGKNDGDDIAQWEWGDDDNFKWCFTPADQTVTSGDTPKNRNTSSRLITTINGKTLYSEVIGDVTIEIFDLHGKRLFDVTPEKMSLTITRKGMYLVRIFGGGLVKTEKFLIE